MSHKPPSDQFTRFTPSTPGASSSSSQRTPPFSSRPPPASQQPSSLDGNTPSSSGSGAPPNETPAERVARLRAASRLAKSRAAMTPLDRVIARGRTIADVTHRVSVYGLLAFTGVSAVVAVYGLTSLVSHNRRQKRAWIEREMQRLEDAQRAFLRGEASAEQLHLLEQERAGDEMARKFEMDKKRKKEEGVWSRVKGLVGIGDMGVEDATKAGLDDTKRKFEQVKISVEDKVENVKELGKEKLLEQGWIGDGGSRTSTPSTTKPAAVSDSRIAGVGFDAKGRPVPAGKMEAVGSVSRGGEGGGRETPQVDSTAPVSITRSGGGGGGRERGSGGQLDVLAGNVATTVNHGRQSWWSWVRGGNSS